MPAKSYSGLLPATPVAEIPCESSGKKTTSSQIFTEPGVVKVVKIFTNGTNNITLEFFDSASGEQGAVHDEWMAKGADLWGGGAPPGGLVFRNGCYVKMTGTGGYFYIGYLDFKNS